MLCCLSALCFCVARLCCEVSPTPHLFVLSNFVYRLHEAYEFVKPASGPQRCNAKGIPAAWPEVQRPWFWAMDWCEAGGAARLARHLWPLWVAPVTLPCSFLPLGLETGIFFFGWWRLGWAMPSG